MINPIELTHIHDLIQARNWNSLRRILAPLPPDGISELLTDFSKTERMLLFRCLGREQAADAFSFLDDELQEQLLVELTDRETRDVLANMSPDDRTALLEEMPAPVTQKLLNYLSPEDRKEALMLLGYPEDSVGRLMSPDFAAVRSDQSLPAAMASIKRQAADSETLNMIYVIDATGRLIDDIPLRRFIMARDDQTVADIMDGHFVALNAYEPQQEAVNTMKQHDYPALPVTDSNGVLLGVVTSDDVLDVAIEEDTEDFHKGGGIRPLEMHYLRAPLQMLYVRRISWLVILVFINIFSGAGIAYYEELIESVVALVFFLPLLIDSGGNAGSQASTLVIRSMALGEVRLLDYVKVAWREIRVALLLGLSMSAAVFLVAWWRSGIDVAQVVALSMTIIVIVGSMVGMSLPFILRKVGLDPAAASAPLVTSVADIAGVLIYLGIAAAMLGQLS
jgi:magnesium transporter